MSYKDRILDTLSTCMIRHEIDTRCKDCIYYGKECYEAHRCAYKAVMALKQSEWKMGELKMQEPDHASSIIDQMINYNMEWIEGILYHNGAEPGSIRANQMVTVYLGMIEAEYRRKYCD